MNVTPEFLKELLDESFWPETLDTKGAYSRVHDDHDGTFKGVISIGFDQMGDAWFFTDYQPPLRFRTWGGGGMSLRTRNALVILAEAIRLDNEDHPQHRPIDEQLPPTESAGKTAAPFVATKEEAIENLKEQE